MSRAIHVVSLSGRERIIERVPQSLLLHDVAADGRALVSHGSVGAGVFFRAPGADKGQRADLANMVDRVGHLGRRQGRSSFEGSRRGGRAPEYDSVRPIDRRRAALARRRRRTCSGTLPDNRWVLASVPQSDDRPARTHWGRRKAAALDRTISRPRSQGAVLPDGKRIVFTAAESGGGLRIFVDDVDGSKAPRPISAEG